MSTIMGSLKSVAQKIKESAQFREKINYKETDWYTALSQVCPIKKRPRRTSPQTLATVLGRTDVLALVKEMEKSGVCFIYRCPDVKCFITYLADMTDRPGMIHTPDSNGWKKFPAFYKQNPIEEVKGFKRFGDGDVGGVKGHSSSAMSYPYEKEDWMYANVIHEALKAKGFTPGLPLYKVPPAPFPGCGDCSRDHKR